MDRYSYRRLTAHDSASLNQLRQVFATAFAEEALWQDAPPPAEYLRTLLENDQYVAVVAECDNQVIGGLVAHVLPKIDRAHNELYLYDLAVAADHRRHGVATSLIEFLKGIGKDIGASVIFVQADNVDTGAVALYEKLADSKETDISHFDIIVNP